MKSSKYFGSRVQQQQEVKTVEEEGLMRESSTSSDRRIIKRIKSSLATAAESDILDKKDSNEKPSVNNLVDLTENKQEPISKPALVNANQMKLTTLVSKGAKKASKMSGPKDSPGVGQVPFCAAPPAKYRCRFGGTCDACFEASRPCTHVTESRLVLLLLGHNPSTHVWTHGYNYGNPTNKMWKLLTGNYHQITFTGCIPPDSPIEYQNKLPVEQKIGFTDIALLPGSDAAEFSDDFMRSWVPNLHARLVSHRDRVRKNENSSDYEGPSIVAFTGKRQFMMMYPTKKEEPRSLPFGRVPAEMLPSNWPLDKQKCQVWVLPSSSGRAAMTHEQRVSPYRALAEEYHRMKATL